MIKAVNMKNYKFKRGSYTVWYVGFGILDTETNEFLSMDGKNPYVLNTKKIVQSCIDAGWTAKMTGIACL